MRQSGLKKKKTQQHNTTEGKGQKEEGGEEARKQRREGRDMMKMMYPKTRKNAVALGKSGFFDVEISKYTSFPSKTKRG